MDSGLCTRYWSLTPKLSADLNNCGFYIGIQHIYHKIYTVQYEKESLTPKLSADLSN